MKKLLALIIISLIAGQAFAGTPALRLASSNSNIKMQSGYQYLSMEAKGAAVTTVNGLVFYGDNIAGFSSIDFYGMAMSIGAVSTTISAQPIYADGSACGAEQVITSATDLTDIRSGYYKFTLPVTSDRTVSFNFLIAD